MAGGWMKTIFYNGRVYTGEEPEKQAFLVEDGLFRAVGSDREILSLGGLDILDVGQVGEEEVELIDGRDRISVHEQLVVHEAEVSRWSSTYNQGTFIGSCLAMWKHTGDGRYYRYAEAAMRYVMRDMYGCGVMDNEERGNDLPGFKGILARYVRRFAEDAGHPEALAWLRMNADLAWKNRNTKGIMWTQLGHQTEDKEDYDVFAVSAAVSVVVNAVGSTL